MLRWSKSPCEWPNDNIDRKKTKQNTWRGISMKPRARKGFNRQNFKAQSIKQKKKKKSGGGGVLYYTIMKDICPKWHMTKLEKICAKSKIYKISTVLVYKELLQISKKNKWTKDMSRHLLEEEPPPPKSKKPVWIWSKSLAVKFRW